jgi:hypothetical protein
VALGEGGAGAHLSGARPPSLSSSSSSPDNESSMVTRGKVPTARAAGILRPSAPGVPAAGSPAPYASSAPIPAAKPCARAQARGVAGRTALRSRPPSAGKDETSESRRHLAEE